MNNPLVFLFAFIKALGIVAAMLIGASIGFILLIMAVLTYLNP